MRRIATFLSVLCCYLTTHSVSAQSNLIMEMLYKMQEELDSTKMEVEQLGHSIEDHNNQIVILAFFVNF